jgi:hypothetical protein
VADKEGRGWKRERGSRAPPLPYGRLANLSAMGLSILLLLLLRLMFVVCLARSSRMLCGRECVICRRVIDDCLFLDVIDGKRVSDSRGDIEMSRDYPIKTSSETSHSQKMSCRARISKSQAKANVKKIGFTWRKLTTAPTHEKK